MPIPDLALSDLTVALEAQYDLKLSTLPRPLPSGVHSRAWLVTAEADMWVVKVSDVSSDSYAKLDQLTHLYQYLNQQGLATPQILPLRDGTTIGMVKIQQVAHLLQLMRYQTMRRATPEIATDTDIRQVAGLAARLHNCLNNYPQRYVFIQDTQKSQNEWGATTEGIFSVLEQQPHHAVLPKADYDWLFSTNQRATAYIQQHYPDPVDLSLAILHGDLNFEHVQFLDDEMPYVFDFGDICWGPIAHELAVFLQSSFRDSTLTIGQWEALREKAITSYTVHRELTSNDLVAIPIFILNRIVAQACYIVELTVAAGRKINWPVIKRTYILAEHLINFVEKRTYKQ